MNVWWSVWLVCALLIAACTPSTPNAAFTTGAIVMEEDFDNAFAWNTFRDPEQGVDFQVDAGVYRIQITRPIYAWTMSTQYHADVVIDVEVTQRSDYANNAYGVICRADAENDGDGYYFLISGEGYFTIRQGVDGIGGEVRALIPWSRSGAIQAGGFNRLRAVCIGDYLALYINGEFVANLRDDTLSRGFLALAGAVAGADGRVNVEFDHLTVYEAQLNE